MSTKNFLEISSLRAAKEVRFATKKVELWCLPDSPKPDSPKPVSPKPVSPKLG